MVIETKLDQLNWESTSILILIKKIESIFEQTTHNKLNNAKKSVENDGITMENFVNMIFW